MIKNLVKGSIVTILFVLFTGIQVVNAQTTPVKPEPIVQQDVSKSDQPGGDKVKLFDRLDLNKDEKISKEEAANNPRFSQNFENVDANKDGGISREELKAFKATQKGSDQRQGSKKEHAGEKKAELDTNGDGKISRDEASKSGNERFLNKFDEMDTDKDGFISKEEKKAAYVNKQKKDTTGQPVDSQQKMIREDQ